ncbi:MAG: transporter substrate-binding domain-containing protein [Fibromonadaceae bacterium]|nr:transporter substrate-binding domain-containing protein [Fibromonadaceae bacterium]
MVSIRKDAFVVGVNKSDSATEYNFISEITAKMKFSKFRIITFENVSAGQKMLLDGKIDAMISKMDYFPYLDNKFLISEPYGKAEMAVAALAKNDEILTLANLDEKKMVFIPRDVSNEQILSIWKNSKPNAVQNLGDALNLLKKREVDVVIASRQSLDAQKDSSLRIFPNRLLENNAVALFAPDSKDLQKEFNKALKIETTALRHTGELYGKASLTALQGVEIFVHSTGDSAIKKMEQEISNKIKQRMENAKVPITTYGSGNGGALKLLLTGFKKKEGDYFIYASLQLHQRAYLAVSHEYMDSQTWDRWRMGIFKEKEIYSEIEDMAREFANDFLSANGF